MELCVYCVYLWWDSMLKKRKEERCQSNLSFAITKQATRNTSHACTQKSFSLKFQPKSSTGWRDNKMSNWAHARQRKWWQGWGGWGKLLYNWKRAKCGFACFLLKLMTKHDLTKVPFQVCASWFFFFSILWCSHHTGNCRQEILAKFGYSSEKKVEKSQHPDTFWQPNGTYCEFQKKNPQNLATFSAIFFTKILACYSGFLFLLPSGKIRPKLRTLLPSFQCHTRVHYHDRPPTISVVTIPIFGVPCEQVAPPWEALS